MLKTTKKKMWTAANIFNHVVSSKTSYVRIILTMFMAKRRLCAANALAVVAWDLLQICCSREWGRKLSFSILLRSGKNLTSSSEVRKAKKEKTDLLSRILKIPTCFGFRMVGSGWPAIDYRLGSREWGRCYYYPLDLASLVAARFSIVG